MKTSLYKAFNSEYADALIYKNCVGSYCCVSCATYDDDDKFKLWEKVFRGKYAIQKSIDYAKKVVSI